MGRINNLSAESAPVLAYIGDAVYELYVREHAYGMGILRTGKMNSFSVKYVRAEAQARVYDILMSGPSALDDTEISVVRRAKNHRITSMPANVPPDVYKKATAFEALIGYLYLDNRNERLMEIINKAFEIIESEDIAVCRNGREDI